MSRGGEPSAGAARATEAQSLDAFGETRIGDSQGVHGPHYQGPRVLGPQSAGQVICTSILFRFLGAAFLASVCVPLYVLDGVDNGYLYILWGLVGLHYYLQVTEACREGFLGI